MTTTITQVVTRGFGYIRVSAEMGRAGKDNFHSPSQQRESIESFCNARGIELVDFVEAIDQSSKRGQNFETEEFQNLKAKIGPGDALVVFAFDRFGRDLGAAMRNIEDIEAKGGSVLSATETNSNDSSGRLARDIFFTFAQYHLNKITDGWYMTQERLHRDGIHHGEPPLGYDKPKTEKGSPLPLVPNGDAWIVEYIFEARRTGTSWADLARSLFDKTGGRRFHRQSLRQITRNRTYLGEVRRGSRPPVVDAHPALVTRSVWEACQDPKRQTWARHDYLLTGIVFCKGCGHRMNRVPKGTSADCYSCQGGRGFAAHECSMKANMTATLLEEHVVSEFFKVLDSKLYGAAHESADLHDLERVLVEAEDDVRMWMQNTAAQRASAALWEEELTRRTRGVADARKILSIAHKSAGTASLPQATAIKQAWGDMTDKQRRKVLTAAVQRIEIGPGKRGIKGLQPDRVAITWA